MTSVAISPKFQIVIPKDIRRALGLVPGQRVNARVVDGRIELVPQLPMTALRGLCPGIDTQVPNDPEGPTSPGGCEPLPEAVWTRPLS